MFSVRSSTHHNWTKQLAQTPKFILGVCEFFTFCSPNFHGNTTVARFFLIGSNFAPTCFPVCIFDYFCTDYWDNLTITQGMHLHDLHHLAPIGNASLGGSSKRLRGSDRNPKIKWGRVSVYRVLLEHIDTLMHFSEDWTLLNICRVGRTEKMTPETTGKTLMETKRGFRSWFSFHWPNESKQCPVKPTQGMKSNGFPTDICRFCRCAVTEEFFQSHINTCIQKILYIYT